MAEKLPTMEEHADALHPVTPRPDSGAPWGRDASGRPKPFQSSVTQGSTIGTKAPPTIPSTPAAPHMGLIEALTGPRARQ